MIIMGIITTTQPVICIGIADTNESVELRNVNKPYAIVGIDGKYTIGVI